MRHLAIVVLLALTGCAAARQKELQETMSKWIGAPESDVVSRWGPPDRVYAAPNARYLTWVRSGNSAGMMVTPTLMGGVHKSCAYTFIVQNNRVSRVQWEGNACHV